jgi:hypothetical protein
MTTNPHNPPTPPTASATGEETLRLIANLQAPAGLEDRVHAALRVGTRRGRVLAWPAASHRQSGWMRTAAAAAIVFVVAGGGWGVYSRVEQNHPAKVIVMPLRPATTGGFEGAGAKRAPQTLPGPTVKQPAKPKSGKKPAARNPVSPMPANGAQVSQAK